MDHMHAPRCSGRCLALWPLVCLTERGSSQHQLKILVHKLQGETHAADITEPEIMTRDTDGICKLFYCKYGVHSHEPWDKNIEHLQKQI